MSPTPLIYTKINLAALNAGKYVYVEKSLAVELEDGIKVVELAKEKGLLVGCVPDTFLGGGLQTCRKLIDDGNIGKSIGAITFILCHGRESWYPDPEFFFQLGG